MRLNIKIALRYLKKRHKLFFSFANLLALSGIIIGVFSLLVVSSVMNGFDEDMQKRVIGSKAEIRIYRQDYAAVENHQQLVQSLQQMPQVKGAAAICESELMLQKKQKIVSTIAGGVNYQNYQKIAPVLGNIVVGAPTAADLAEDGIILGLGMSVELQATVGEYVTLSSPLGTIPTPLGLLPKSKKMKVVGLISSDLPEFNSLHSYISLANGQYFLGEPNAVSRIEVSTYQPEKSAAVAQQISQLLGAEYQVEDWSEFEANLFNAIKLEKAVMFFVLALMIVIASFNMIGNFIKLVTEKRTEIGVLKAMGMADRDIWQIFVLIGTILGSLGTLIGVLLALALLITQQVSPFISIPVPGFPLVWLPVKLELAYFIFVPLLVIFISFITTLYPARKTYQIEAIKIIRNQE
ncbi:MAG: ABC transporter permease [Candidatus Cloacimonadales bacterium]